MEAGKVYQTGRKSANKNNFSRGENPSMPRCGPFPGLHNISSRGENPPMPRCGPFPGLHNISSRDENPPMREKEKGDGSIFHSNPSKKNFPGREVKRYFFLLTPRSYQLGKWLPPGTRKQEYGFCHAKFDGCRCRVASEYEV